MSKTALVFIVLAVLLLASVDAAKKKPASSSLPNTLYSITKSYVTNLAKANFDKIIGKNREYGVSIVHFYKFSDDAADLLAADIDKSANEMTGVFRFGAVDCELNSDVCAKEGVTKTPTVRIYPPLPVPVMDHEGELSAKKILDAAGKYVPGDRVKEINSTILNRFIENSPSVPKVLLFTEKRGIPLIYRALANAFDKKIFLGIVRSSETDIVKKYKVTKFPSVLVVKTGEGKPTPYTGELKYQPLFEFLNVYSQTFVPGGDQLNSNKPWLTETAPEYNLKSASDTFLKTDGKLAVVYLTKNGLDEAVKAEFEKLAANARFENFKYGWLNVDAEPAWAKVYAKALEYPKVVVSSFGKRKKYLVHENDVTAVSIAKTLEKILNGDSQFTTIRGELPTFQH